MTAPAAGADEDRRGAATYRGRFAPSPTGSLHAGSLVAALASWLDARAHRGRWLVRIEDVDTPRCVPGAGDAILAQLAALGLVPDEPPVWQSTRSTDYEHAAMRLLACDWAYPCGCTRAEIAQASARQGAARQRTEELVYPGTCRGGLRGKPARALRVSTCSARGAPGTDMAIEWHDRRLGTQCQDVSRAVGDFVLRRADGVWAYQLAVVVDDAAQGITHVVRGEDLADNTPRQIHLQRLLGLPTPTYLHAPLVLGRDGNKLSKQNGAEPVDVRDPVAALNAASRWLGLALSTRPSADDPAAWLAEATHEWRSRWVD